ncbi:hypothetical protein TNCV_3105291 [Trichonephila clavipes]|nr:hypothetical protein TNCV_3105291 [Trichonephila clavipes]
MFSTATKCFVSDNITAVTKTSYEVCYVIDVSGTQIASLLANNPLKKSSSNRPPLMHGFLWLHTSNESREAVAPRCNRQMEIFSGRRRGSRTTFPRLFLDGSSILELFP